MSPPGLSEVSFAELEKLATGPCVPCEGINSFSPEDVANALTQLPGWSFRENSIEKEFHFPSYSAGLDFARRIGKEAESQNHHPDLIIRWRRVKVIWTTHTIHGISQNDIVMAARTELDARRNMPQ